MHLLKPSSAVLGAALLSSAASAAEYQSWFYFQDNLVQPVGIGAMTFTGEAPGDGLYAASSFSDLKFAFQFHPLFTELGTFSEADLLTDLNSFSIHLIGTTFQFSGPASGLFHGSAEFANDEGDFLAFSPSDYPQFAYAVLIDRSPGPEVGEPEVFGVYGSISAVPEPSSTAALAGAAALGLVGLRRRRRA